MPQVHVIEPIHSHEPAKLRVCAYARVSSDSADQLNSFAAQVRYYTNLIAGNEDWTLVDIYADRGITGTSTAKRTEFQRMMEDCRKGKIDRILVKSLSRFARNTQDCIAALRELRQLGVTVVFEKEHINTGTMANEMLISMMSAFAQEESVSISKNMRKGVQMRMQNGACRLSKMPYGYKFGQNGEYVIDEEEAEVVRYIFRKFLAGAGVDEIVESLHDRGIKRRDGNPRWHGNSIGYILKNEKYVGDEVWGKRHTTDGLPFKQVPNHGESPRYLLFDTHPAIIDRADFEKVQILLEQKSRKYHAGQRSRHLFTNLLICRVCGATYYHRERGGQSEWVCGRRYRDAAACRSSTIREERLIKLYQRMVWKLQQQDCEILRNHIEMLSRIKTLHQAQALNATELSEIAALLEQSHTLHRLWTTGCVDAEFFYAKEHELQNAIYKKRQSIQHDRNEGEKLLRMDATRDILRCIEVVPTHSFDKECFARIVQKIAIDKEQVVFILHNGLELSESREEDT